MWVPYIDNFLAHCCSMLIFFCYPAVFVMICFFYALRLCSILGSNFCVHAVFVIVGMCKHTNSVFLSLFPFNAYSLMSIVFPHADFSMLSLSCTLFLLINTVLWSYSHILCIHKSRLLHDHFLISIILRWSPSDGDILISLVARRMLETSIVCV